MGIPSRILDRALVLSKLKQTAWGTVLTDVNLQAGKRFAPASPVFGTPESAYYTDRNRTMKGHNYVTEVTEVRRELAEQIAFENGDSWLLAWICAFGMGAVASAQPNAGGNPTAYDHTIKPLDPASSGKDMPVTTVYAEANNAANLKRRLHCCAIRELAIDFPPDAPVSMSATLQGSGQVTTGVLASQPAFATLNKLLSNNLQILYGAQGAPTDISSEVVHGSVKFSFNWGLDDDHSRVPGGGLYRSRAWVGTPQFSIEFQRLVDDTASTPNDDQLASTAQEIQLVVAGAQIGAGPETHKLVIRGLAVKPETLKLGQSGDKTCYQYSLGPDKFLKEGSNDVATIKVTNLETSYFV